MIPPNRPPSIVQNQFFINYYNGVPMGGPEGRKPHRMAPTMNSYQGTKPRNSLANASAQIRQRYQQPGFITADRTMIDDVNDDAETGDQISNFIDATNGSSGNATEKPMRSNRLH
jgi:hypothetical protein